MTRKELIAFGKARHGEIWIGPLSGEIGYDPSTILRIVTGEIKTVSRRLELEIKQLKPRPQRTRTHA